jgi:hypothetical protein
MERFARPRRRVPHAIVGSTNDLWHDLREFQLAHVTVQAVESAAHETCGSRKVRVRRAKVLHVLKHPPLQIANLFIPSRFQSPHRTTVTDDRFLIDLPTDGFPQMGL